MAEQTILCPKCGQRIPITQALTAQIEAHLREEFEAEARKWEKGAQAAYEEQLAKREAEIREKAQRESDSSLKALREQLSQAQKREQAAEAGFERRLAVEGIPPPEGCP